MLSCSSVEPYILYRFFNVVTESSEIWWEYAWVKLAPSAGLLANASSPPAFAPSLAASLNCARMKSFSRRCKLISVLYCLFSKVTECNFSFTCPTLRTNRKTDCSFSETSTFKVSTNSSKDIFLFFKLWFSWLKDLILISNSWAVDLALEHSASRRSYCRFCCSNCCFFLRYSVL